MMISRLNDILGCFNFFSFSCFNFLSVFLVLLSILSHCLNNMIRHLNDIVSRLNDIFVVFISILSFLFQFLFRVP